MARRVYGAGIAAVRLGGALVHPDANVINLDAAGFSATRDSSDPTQVNVSALTSSGSAPAAHASTHLPGGSDAIQLASETQAGLMSPHAWLAAHLYLEGDRSDGDATIGGAMTVSGRQYRDATLSSNLTPVATEALVMLWFRSLNLNGFNVDSSALCTAPAAGANTASASGSHMGCSLSSGGGAISSGAIAGADGADGNAGADGSATFSGGGAGSGAGGGGGVATTGGTSSAGGSAVAMSPLSSRPTRLIRDPFSLPSFSTSSAAGLLVGSCGAGSSGGGLGGGGVGAGSGVAGGKGAGANFLSGETLSGTGVVKANGGDGIVGGTASDGGANQGGGGGGGSSGAGAGGVNVVKALTVGGGVTLQANGGTGPTGGPGGAKGTGVTGKGGRGGKGGNGAAGRNVLVTL